MEFYKSKGWETKKAETEVEAEVENTEVEATEAEEEIDITSPSERGGDTVDGEGARPTDSSDEKPAEESAE